MFLLTLIRGFFTYCRSARPGLIVKLKILLHHSHPQTQLMNKPKEQPEGSYSETRITITTHWRHGFLIVQLGTLSQRHACVWPCSLISEYIWGERLSCENVFMVTKSAELNDAFFFFYSVRKFRQLVACWVCVE